MIDSFVLLALSFRGSERVPTEFGGQLDTCRPFDRGYWRILKQFTAGGERLETLFPASHAGLRAAKCTQVMKSRLSSMFEMMYFVAPESERYVRFGLEGVTGVYRLDHAFVAGSDRLHAGAVEGDDLVFLLFFSVQEGIEADAVVTLDRRFESARDSWWFLAQLGVVAESPEPRFKDGFRPGFYFIPQQKIFRQRSPFKDFGAWIAESRAHRQAVSVVAGYLYYCWLICQRVERLAGSISVNGDWDVESRKLILARKKAVAGRQYAFVKNRAEPDSHILPVFRGISDVLRLGEQLHNVSELLDEAGKAMEAQNAYTASGRLQAIEVIVFLSTILALAVGLNTIQMPPFYDQTTANALGRREFWVVFAIVTGIAFIAWGFLTHWRRVKRLVHRIRCRFAKASDKK